MVQLTKAYNQVIKKFLIETFGFENINAYCVIDSDIIGFRIRQMNFLIDCETMSIKRELERTEDGRHYCTTAIDCEICNMVERSLKQYLNNEIEKMQNGGN